MLLNISVFLWYGAIAPWASFRSNDVIPLYRLVLLGVLILLFRRLPMVFAFHKKIPEIEEFHQALFVGYFGPIGVSAVFYLYVSIDFLRQVQVNGQVREDAARLEEVMRVVVWFLAICSIVGHGLSVPLGKMGYTAGRTMSQALSSEREDEQGTLGIRRQVGNQEFQLRRRRNRDQPRGEEFRIGTSPLSTEGGGIETYNPQEPARPIRFVDSGPPTGRQSPVEQSARDRL